MGKFYIVLLAYGTENEKKRLMDVSKMATRLGDSPCDSLIRLYQAFSESEPVSSILG